MTRPARIAALLAIALALTAAPGSAATPRASLTDIENDVMCVSCHEPLAVAQSPQAIAERGFISSLISRGETKQQIEQALVAQYGQAVLGKPPAHGFNLTVYVLPPALVLGGVALLALTLPRWRARSNRHVSAIPGSGQLTPSDERRLNDDLARFDT